MDLFFTQLLHLFFYCVKDIPKVIFEPVLIGVFLGLLCLHKNYNFRTHYKKFVLGFALLLFMIIWRSFFTLESSRYISILIYPGCLLAAYGCIYGKKICNIFFLNQYVLLTVLLLSCFFKIIYYDRCHNSLIEAAEYAKESSHSFQKPYFITKEDLRVNYYSKIEAYNPYKSPQTTQTLKAHLLDKIWENYDIFFYLENNTKKQKSGFQLEQTPYIAELDWKQLKQWDYNKNKNTLTLYQFIPDDKISVELLNETEWKQFSQEKNLLSDYRFSNSKISSQAVLDDNYAFFENTPNKEAPIINALPQGWSVKGTVGYDPGNNSCLDLRYYQEQLGLFLDARSTVGVFCQKLIPVDSYSIIFKVNTLSESLFSFGVHTYDKDGHFLHTYQTAPLEGARNGSISGKFTIPQSLFGDATKFRLIYILNKGSVILEDINLQPLY